MQLQLAVVAFQSAHFYYAWLLQVVQPQAVVLDVVAVLNDPRHCADNVRQVITFVVNLIYLGAGFWELTLKAGLDNRSDQLRMRLVANFEHIFLSDLLVKSRRSRLQIIQRVSHVALCSEN